MKYIILLFLLCNCTQLEYPIQELAEGPESVICGWNYGGIFVVPGKDDGYCHLLTPDKDTAITELTKNICDISNEDQQPLLVKYESVWKIWSKTGSNPQPSIVDVNISFPCN